MSTTPDKLVERYLKHLEVELDDVPSDRRREIVDEIAGHIAEARAALEHETEADVRNILEGLGDPAEIAADARELFELPASRTAPYKAGWMEVGALVLLLIGGIVIPFFGWFIGVVLLWVSNAWNVRDKIIGTVFVPGGLGLSLFILLSASFMAGGGVSTCVFNPTTGENHCTPVDGSGWTVLDVLKILVVAGIIVAPIITT